ncbi:hypothetical protein LJB95_01550 [Paludibacteraceae bacterium OttesenSCG-928-F17]|nr:hypothetical protein [Paludibacteraceae bacterium OttesenSCG-928-F17]
MKITISSEIKEKCPELSIAVLRCKVKNTISSDELWIEIDSETERIKSQYKLEEINKRPEIYATRQAYKKLGKDPNRYRPSAEALCRRILRDIPLYKLNTLVDFINLVSIRSGFSIGGFDADKIKGDVVLGVGTQEDVFEGIGRGLLNIEGLPVYRDEEGGIGTPTSDNERTKITMDTTSLLMIINGYSGKAGLTYAVDYSIDLLKKYAELSEWTIEYL